MPKLYVCEEYKTPYEEGYRRICSIEEHDKQIKTEVIEEFKEKMKNLNQLNCFVDYVSDEIDLEELMYYASEEIADELKEQNK